MSCKEQVGPAVAIVITGQRLTDICQLWNLAGKEFLGVVQESMQGSGPE